MTHLRAWILLALLAGAARAQEAPQVVWTLDLEAPSFGSGVIADVDGDGALEVAFGTYYGDARLRVVRGGTGEVLFERASGGGPMDASCAALPAGADGAPGVAVLVADSADGTLWAYSGDGAERWRTTLPSGTDSPLAVADVDGDGQPELLVGTMRVRGGPGRVVCLDARTREARWSAPLEGHVQAGPVVTDLDGDDRPEVLAGAWRGDGRLVCLDGGSGAERWSVAVGEQYHGPAVGELEGRNGVVACGLAGDDVSRVVCLEKDGARRWERRLEGEYLFAPPLLVDADGDGALEVLVVGRAAWLLSARGATRWRAALPGSCARGATPVDLDGDGAQDLLLGAGPALVALRGRDGALLWTFAAGAGGGSPYEAIDAPILLADLTGDGALEAFFVCGAGTSEAGATNYGRAFAVRLPGVRGASWTRFRGGAGHTGCAADRD